jgi:hypothetical protein
MEVDEAQEAIAVQEAAETGDVAPSAESEARPRRRGRKRADSEQSSPRGSKGEEIFERVNELTEAEGLNRSEAFARIADSTGSRAGAVAANYYRVARKRGGRRHPTPRPSGWRKPDVDINAGRARPARLHQRNPGHP